MIEIDRDIDSLSGFKRRTPEFLRRLKETGRPVVLTVNGKAELVVQDAASYQRLREAARSAEDATLRASVAEMRAGQAIPAAEVLAEMRQALADKAKKKPRR